MATYVALLYSIVLSPQRRVVMSDLKTMALELCLEKPRTLAATGNLVFEARALSIPQLEARLETAFKARFGKHVDIIVRDAEAWRRTIAANPFPAESEQDGSLVLLRVMREPLGGTVLTGLEPYRDATEKLALVQGDLWTSFGDRPSQSRLLGVLTKKRLGIGTSRNWNTVRGLADLLG